MSLPDRNAACPCGSGKKAKRCCAATPALAPVPASSLSEDLQAVSGMIDGGQYAYAEELCRQILSKKPGHAQTWFNLGVAQQLADRPQEAAASYLNALKYKKDYPQAMSNLGMALIVTGQLEEGMAWSRKAIALKRDYAEPHNNLGVAYGKQNQYEEAERWYRKAIALQPNYALALDNLGSARKEQGDLEGAVTCYRQAIAADPQCVHAYSNLGLALQQMGSLDEAAACFQSAIARHPGFAEAHFNLGRWHADHGDLEQAVACYRKATELQPDYADAHTNLLLTASYSAAISPEALFADHRRFGELLEAPLKSGWRHDNSPDPERRLKIGYVSADFRNHAAAYFIEPVLANHDKAAFEVTCYSNNLVRDAVTDRIEAMADHWHVCAEWSDQQLAEQVKRDGIDILVDLSGHSAGNRLPAFARKPAPLQANWIGYAGTTGLTAVDYRITDRYMDPPGVAEAQHTERLLRLPTIALFRYVEDSPPVAPLPALESGVITFSCLNNLKKLNAKVAALWTRILAELPRARLMIGNAGEARAQQRVRTLFAEAGVPAERLLLRPGLPMREYLELHAQIDIALDPFPYNGGTSTNHSLWMGVPTITLAGDRTVARVGASMMMRAGLPEFIVRDEDEYVQRVLEFAADLPRLSAIRHSLRERLAANPDNEPLQFTRNLERELREAWRRWCAERRAL